VSTATAVSDEGRVVVVLDPVAAGVVFERARRLAVAVTEDFLVLPSTGVVHDFGGLDEEAGVPFALVSAYHRALMAESAVAASVALTAPGARAILARAAVADGWFWS
jgi:hypothetical protein